MQISDEAAKIVYRTFKSGTEDQLIGKINDALKKLKYTPVQSRNLMRDNDFISDTMSAWKSLGGKWSK